MAYGTMEVESKQQMPSACEVCIQYRTVPLSSHGGTFESTGVIHFIPFPPGVVLIARVGVITQLLCCKKRERGDFQSDRRGLRSA